MLLAGNARNVCSRGPHDVEPGKPTKIPLEVREGIPLTGTLEEEDGDDFEWMIVDEDNYVKYRQGERFAALASGRDKGAYKVWVVIPRRGPWFLVLEAYGKQLIREVWAELRLGS